MIITIGGKKFAAANIAILNDYKKEEYLGGQYDLIPSNYARISLELLPYEDIKLHTNSEEPSWCQLERMLVEVAVPAKLVFDFIEGKQEIVID